MGVQVQAEGVTEGPAERGDVDALPGPAHRPLPASMPWPTPRRLPGVPLSEYGLDSVYVLGLSAEIKDHYGIEVEPAVMWDHTSLAPLANPAVADRRALNRPPHLPPPRPEPPR